MARTTWEPTVSAATAIASIIWATFSDTLVFKALMIGVSTTCGHSTETPTLVSAKSLRKNSLNPTRANLLVPYPDWWPWPWIPLNEAVLTICASSPCSSMPGKKTLIPLCGPQKFTSWVMRHRSSGVSSTFAPPVTPALLHKRCKGPKVRSTALAALAKASRSVESTLIVSTRSVICLRCCSALVSASSRMSVMTTFISWRANVVAIPSPIPVLPPVINAVLPARVSIVFNLRRCPTQSTDVANAKQPSCRYHGDEFTH